MKQVKTALFGALLSLLSLNGLVSAEEAKALPLINGEVKKVRQVRRQDDNQT